MWALALKLEEQLSVPGLCSGYYSKTTVNKLIRCETTVKSVMFAFC